MVVRQSWETEMGRRGGVWVDEPVTCSAGCRIPSEDVQRLLLRVLEQPAGAAVRELALWTQEAAG